MYQKNLGRQIWAILSPIVVYYITTFLVETIFSGYHFVMNQDQIEQIFSSSATQEELMLRVTEFLYTQMFPYLIEMTGAAALVSMPVLIWMIVRDRKRETLDGLSMNVKAPLAKYVYVLAISIPFALGLNNLIMLLNLPSYSEAYQEATEVFYSAQLAVQVICLGILTPIAEELVFRGLIFKRMRRLMKHSGRAIVFSGLLFGFYHGNMVQMIYACLSGFLLAYLYEKYGSIKAPILAHMCMNLVALTLTEAEIFTWMFKSIWRVGPVTVACAAIASMVFLFIQKIGEKPLKNDEN